MTWGDFKRLVLETFGPGLERTNYGSVHTFCAEVREQISPSPREGGAFLLIDEPAIGYDEVMREYFESALDQSPDQAAISLWLYAFENWYSERGDADEERFRGILGDDDLMED